MGRGPIMEIWPFSFPYAPAMQTMIPRVSKGLSTAVGVTIDPPRLDAGFPEHAKWFSKEPMIPAVFFRFRSIPDYVDISGVQLYQDYAERP